MKWNVVKAVPQKHGWPKTKPLGTVDADNAPLALQAACEKWPEEIDESQVQRGFSVRPVKA